MYGMRLTRQSTTGSGGRRRRSTSGESYGGGSNNEPGAKACLTLEKKKGCGVLRNFYAPLWAAAQQMIERVYRGGAGSSKNAFN